MKHNMKRLLAIFLASAMVAASPAPSTAYAATNESTDAAVTKPTLPTGFSAPLEDNNGMTNSGATVANAYGWDKVIDTTIQWNNQDQGHASITNASELFKTSSFTVLMDVRQTTPDADSSKSDDDLIAFTIGSADNNIRVMSYTGKLFYGSGQPSKGNPKNIALTNIEKNGWNAIAMTYEETNNGNGHVIVYINGEKAGEVEDIGFKLSSMNNITATIARTFNTNYMQKGRYDNIVVGDSVLDEATAKAETAYRKYTKENTIEPVAISIKGTDVDTAAANKNGLTYKGFGMLNGNSTSNLLLDYKYEHPDKYNEMMEYLFGGEYPLFTHIKMEMGNDGNNSTGAEACTMRTETEAADASRSPGFVMAADAKKINPDVKISILRWEMPNWVKAKWDNNTDNQGYEAMYKWYKETIFDAYEKYGYVVDFVNPDKNETGSPDTSFIKWFSNRVKNETEFPNYMDVDAQTAYKNIRIIASDENKGLKIVPEMRNDSALYDAVDIIGFHYRTNATDDYVTMADVDDKEVWYSEGCATFGYSELQENKTAEYGYKSIGGYQSPLALMDSFITAFDSSRRTHYMFQPAIGAFYEGIQYGHKELLSARDPWSGYIHYDPALYMLQHFAKFAKTGWEDSTPNTNDIWRVIRSATDGSFEGTDNEHATAGINGKAGYMTLASPDKKDFSVVFVNNTKNRKVFTINTDMTAASSKDLHFWLTETDDYMQNKGTIQKGEDGSWLVELPAYSVATATTLSTEPERTPQEVIHNEDRAVLDTDASGRTNGITDDNVLYADDFDYEEYTGEQANYLQERGNEPRYMLDTHGAWVVEEGRLKHDLSSSVAQWNGGEPSTIVGDFRWMDYTTSVDIQIPDASANTTARVTVRAQTGMNWNNSGYSLELNGSGAWNLYRIGTKVASGSVPKDAGGNYKVKVSALGDTINVSINNTIVANYHDTNPMLSGRVKLSSSWNQLYFDNLLIENIDSGIPYATTMVDGQDDCVSYDSDDNWTIDNPGSGSADDWYRTNSINKQANATFSFPITGAGFAILGRNDGSATLDVYVDDVLIAENAATLASPSRGETYILSDLEYGAHTIKVVVKSGTLRIDALHTLAGRLSESPDVLVSVNTDNLPVLHCITPDISSIVNELPTEVEVLTNAGTTVTKNVVWNTSLTQFNDTLFQKTSITGTVLNGVTGTGLPLTVSIPVEMVIPAGTVYLIDTVDAQPAADATTEPFAYAKELLGDQILNDCSDQLKTDSNTWGLVDTDAQTKDYNSTTDMMATGIYAKNNTKGETLSYAFTLPAGKYKLYSGHIEWWNNRSMTASINVSGQTTDAGTITIGSQGATAVNTAEFTLTSEQLVTYTLTATGNNAPVISYLVVSEITDDDPTINPPAHEHNYTIYSDNGNGTHSAICEAGDDIKTETHEAGYTDNGNGTHSSKCTQCNVTESHNCNYTDNNNGKHTATCRKCDFTIEEEHAPLYTNKGDGTHSIVCELCGYNTSAAHVITPKDNGNGTHTLTCKDCDYTKTENHALTYKDNGNGTHTASCPTCNYSKAENHTFANNVCSLCSAKQAADNNHAEPSKPAISATENLKKGIKVTWNQSSNAAGYYIDRKAGKGAWTRVATITTAATTSYSDAKANTNGTQYQYKVTAYAANGKTAESSIKSIYRLDAVKKLTLKNVKGKKMSVKWTKNKKAKKYEIQYSTKKNFSKAKKLKVSGKSKTISKLKKGKYYVRIRCIKSSSYSAWTSKNIKISK